MLLLALLSCTKKPTGSGIAVKAAAARVQTDAPRPPNVLILLADDVGTDMVGVYAEHPEPARTPNIDALAARGRLFRNGYTHSMCSPTRAALMTGHYADRYGLGWYLHIDQDDWELPPDVPTSLPRLATSWNSAAVGKWHLTTRSKSGASHPNDVGWSYHAGSISNPTGSLKKPKKGRKKGYRYWEKVINGKPTWSSTYMAVDTRAEALAKMTELPEPWLLYVAFNDAHSPFQAPPPELAPVRGEGKRARFLAKVEAMDAVVGDLVEEAGDDTLVFFLGDNGSPRQVVAPPRVPEHAKGSLYEGGTNVPFVVAGPGIAPGETQALAHAVDITATIAAIAGVEAELDGVDLRPVLDDPTATVREYVYTSQFKPFGFGPYKHDHVAVRDARWKLYRKDGQDHLFDLNDRYDDGQDLLGGEVTGEQHEAHRRLSKELDRLLGTVRPYALAR